jgi:hypothetical protein
MSAIAPLLGGKQTFADVPGEGMFNVMKARHEIWMEKYPNTTEARDWPPNGENARPETIAAGPTTRGRFEVAVRSQGVRKATQGLGGHRDGSE